MIPEIKDEDMISRPIHRHFTYQVKGSWNHLRTMDFGNPEDLGDILSKVVPIKTGNYYWRTHKQTILDTVKEIKKAH